MATRGQITEKAVLVQEDEYRKTFPVESYVDETYWADLPFGQRARWMWTQQVIQNSRTCTWTQIGGFRHQTAPWFVENEHCS